MTEPFRELTAVEIETLRAGLSPGARFRLVFNAYFGTDFENGPPEQVLGAMADYLLKKLEEE